jgi:PAS domain S-box-containing protein
MLVTVKANSLLSATSTATPDEMRDAHAAATNILIVDDRPCNLKFLRAIFEGEGMTVHEANNGEEALATLGRESISAIVSDLAMPCMDGFRLCTEVRRREEFSTVPFVAYSATYTTSRDRQLIKDLGADEFLLKPTPPSVLTRTVMEFVHKGVAHPVTSLPDERSLQGYYQRLTTRLAEKDAALSAKAGQLAAVDAELRRTNTLLQHVFDETPAVIYSLELDGETVQPRFASENITRLLGYTVMEALSYEWWLSRLHPDDAPRAIASLDETVAQGATRTEYRLLHRDGGVRWIDDRRRVVRDASGRPVELIGAWIDITDRRRAEQRMKLTASVGAVLAEAVSLNEAGPSILEAICRELQLDTGELWVVDNATKAARCAEIWVPPSSEFRDFVTMSREFTCVRGTGLAGRVWAAGESIWCEDIEKETGCLRRDAARRAGLHAWIGSPIKLHAETLGVVGFFSARIRPLDPEALAVLGAIGLQIGQFIERKRIEAQFLLAQKMEALGALAGGVAHDFNNILAAISGYCELSRLYKGMGQDIGPYLDGIMNGTQRAVALVRQILAFSRPQTQEHRAIQLRHIVADALQLLRAATPTMVEFESVLERDAPVVLADATQIHQIVMNLGTNAAHAMRAQGGRLTVRLEKFKADKQFAATHAGVQVGNHARLMVQDTGHGMDAATLERIYEPFFTTKPEGEGTGLGLAVVYGIVQRHHGAIFASSRPGEGTTFEIYLPAHLAEAEVAVDVPTDVPRGAGQRILFVDDEATIADIGRRILEKIGYRAEACTNPKDAFARVAANPTGYALVITDQSMPDLTGPELARQITALRPDLPVLLTTGFTAGVPDEQLRSNGIRQVLPKPLAVSSLAHAVRQTLLKARATPA